MSWNFGLQLNNLYQIVRNLQTTALTNPSVSNLNMNNYSIIGTNSFSTTGGITDTSTAGIVCTNATCQNITSTSGLPLTISSAVVTEPQRTNYTLTSYTDGTLGQITVLRLTATPLFTKIIPTGSQVTLAGLSPASANGTWLSLSYSPTYITAGATTGVILSGWLNGTFTSSGQEVVGVSATVTIISGGRINLNNVADVTATGIALRSGKFLSGDQIIPTINTLTDQATVTLTATSPCYQLQLGSTPSTYTLPDATTIQIGFSFTFNNNTNQTLTIRNAVATLLHSVQEGGITTCICLDHTTANGTWDIHSYLPSNTQFGTTGMLISATTPKTIGTLGTGNLTVTSDAGLLTLKSAGALSLQSAGSNRIQTTTSITLSPDSDTGDLIFTGAHIASTTAGSNSAQHLRIKLNDVYYKIALRNDT